VLKPATTAASGILSNLLFISRHKVGQYTVWETEGASKWRRKRWIETLRGVTPCRRVSFSRRVEGYSVFFIFIAPQPSKMKALRSVQTLGNTNQATRCYKSEAPNPKKLRYWKLKYHKIFKKNCNFLCVITRCVVQ